MNSENEWVETAHETGDGATRNGDGDPSAESHRTCRNGSMLPATSAKEQLGHVAVTDNGYVCQWQRGGPLSDLSL